MLFAFAGTFYYIGHHPNWSRFLLLIAVVVVAARVVAGVHYPSDVLAGAVLGLVVAKIVSWQSQWLDEQMK
jgi:undecaprenyl-diphosphatase